MKHRTIGVSEFKAKCLDLLEEIAKQGGTITVTKRGKPLATVGPVGEWKSPKGMWKGKVSIAGDIEDLSELWGVRGARGARD